MKEVLDISLQGFSFVIEKDAYEMLEGYLGQLKDFYDKEDQEVMNDIEERIAELLIERGCCNGAIVNSGHIKEIIGILGRPSEIGDLSGGGKDIKVKKGMYRDPQNAVVAGVCSGLGAYFNMDAVWVRLIMIAISIVGAPIGSFVFMLLAYLVLWIIMPQAKTVSQRCAMRGEPQSVDHIHRKFVQGAKEVGGQMWQAGSKATGTVVATIWRLACFAAGVMLALLGFGGIVALGVGFVGIDMVAGISPLAMPDFIDLNIGSTVWLKIFGVLTVLLPFVGMLYAGLKLCFNFKAPKWRPGLVMFVVWLASALIFIFCAAKAFNPYYDFNSNNRVRVDIPGAGDTLYVVCPKAPGMEKAKMHIDVSGNFMELFYLENQTRKNTLFALYPNLEIKRSDEAAPVLDVTLAGFTKPTFYDEFSSDTQLEDVIEVDGSTITIKPAVYSRQSKFSGNVQHVKLRVPEDMVVVLKEPFNHVFGKSKSYRSGIH